MLLDIKYLPNGSLPYENARLFEQMMSRLFRDLPYLPELPLLAEGEDIVTRTIGKIPFFSYDKHKRLLLKEVERVSSEDKNVIELLYNSKLSDELDKYASSAFFMGKYLEILKKRQPKYTLIKLLGIFSLLQMVTNIDVCMLMTDKGYIKFLTQLFCVRVMWFIKEVKKNSPKTIPVILFEEPLLPNIGHIIRKYENFDKTVLVSFLSRIIRKLKENGAVIGVQCLKKCDWQIPIDSGADIISFDAYTNPYNLNIIGAKVNDFLAHGGYINFGIVPVTSEYIIKQQTLDSLHAKFLKIAEGLIAHHVNSDLLYSRSMVSVQGDMLELPIIFAEKALMLVSKLSAKIEVPKSLLPQSLQ